MIGVAAAVFCYAQFFSDVNYDAVFREPEARLP